MEEERKDSSDLRGMARDALNADLSPFHLYRSHSAFRIPSHFRARSRSCIITLSGRNREGYGEEERVYGEIDETNRPGNFFFLSLGKVF